MRSKTVYIILVFSACITSGINCYAKTQSLREIDEQVKAYLEDIYKWGYGYEAIDPEQENWDSLVRYNKLLIGYLDRTCKTIPETLTFGFDSAVACRGFRLGITSSRDKKLRFYYWDTETGGTMRFYNAIAQYAAADGVKTLVLNDVSKKKDCWSYYDTIYAIKTNSQIVYIVVSTGVLMSSYRCKNIESFCVQNNKLIKVPFFKTNTKMLSRISYAYWLSENDFDVHLNNTGDKLYIPLMNKEEKFTDKWLVYNFDGEKFVYDKNAK